MPFNALQLTHFFTSNTQMALTNAQREALSREGLASVTDFVDFKEDELKVAFKNARAGIPGTPMIPAIPAVMQGNNVAQAAVPAVPGVPGIPSVPIPARSITRLLIASVAYHYYVDTGRAVTNTNMHFTNVLRDFHVEWKAMESMSTQESPTLPILSKNNPPLKWCESFKNFLYASFGVRKVPLLYIIRNNVAVTPEMGADVEGTYDPLQEGKSFGSSGSVLEDLIARSSHTHPLFKSDNAVVYGYIEEAARTSTFAHTIKSYARTKDGRGAWLAIVTSHVGVNQWEKIARDNTAWLINTKWTGKGYSLEIFISQSRAKFQQLEEAAIHVNSQVPTEHSRVGYLLGNIENSNAALQAALASIRLDTEGMRQDFESAAATLIPVDPFVQNKANKKSTPFDISSMSTKSGRGSKTGVDLRWHAKHEFQALSSEQKDELIEWQKTKDGKKIISDSKSSYFNNKKKRKAGDSSSNGKSSKKRGNNARIAALEKKLADQTTQINEESKLADISAALKASRSTSSDQASLARTILSIASRPKQD